MSSQPLIKFRRTGVRYMNHVPDIKTVFQDLKPFKFNRLCSKMVGDEVVATFLKDGGTLPLVGLWPSSTLASAGYFEAVLYQCPEGRATLSINPTTQTPGLMGWYPAFIPLIRPVTLKTGDTLVASFWRKSTSTKVWYEWTVISPDALNIHNVNGSSYAIGLDLA